MLSAACPDIRRGPEPCLERRSRTRATGPLSPGGGGPNLKSAASTESRRG